MATITVGIPNSTFIASAAPGTNYSAYALDYVGTDPSFGLCTSLLQIELPVLPITAVDSAILRLSVIAKTGAGSSQINVNRVTAPFDVRTVTYGSQPASVPTGIGFSVQTSDLYHQVAVDITAIVNAWLAGADNDGIALVIAEGDASLVEFANANIVYEPYFPTLEVSYSTPASESSAVCFSYAQLAHVIGQLMELYAGHTFSVFTTGLVANTITGTPSQLYVAPDGSYGGLFILTDAGAPEVIPLSSITAIYVGDGTVYDPSINYLVPSSLTPGCDKNIISAIYSYFGSLPPLQDVTMYLGSNITASGNVYLNEYGLIVLSDTNGNTPVFLTVTHITAIQPSIPPPDAKSDASRHSPRIETGPVK